MDKRLIIGAFPETPSLSGSEEHNLCLLLPTVVDGEAPKETDGQKRMREWWNSVMSVKWEEGNSVAGKPSQQHTRAATEPSEISNSVKAVEPKAPARSTSKEDLYSSPSSNNKGKQKVELVNGILDDEQDVQLGQYAHYFSDFDFGFDSDSGPDHSSPNTPSRSNASVTESERRYASSSGIGMAYSTHAERASRPVSPTTLTWDIVVNRILRSGHIHPSIVEAVQQRIAEAANNSQITMTDAGLVPSFSCPLAYAPFYDRLATESSRTQHHTPQQTSLLSNGPIKDLPNGVLAPSSSPSPTPVDRSRPSGFPNPQELPRLLNSRPSTPVSPTTQLALHEGTIATQAKLIRTLHAEIDKLTHDLEDVQLRTLPQLCTSLATSEGVVEQQRRLGRSLRMEIEELKMTVDFAVRVLTGTWEREWEVWRWVGEMRERKLLRKRSCCSWLFNRGRGGQSGAERWDSGGDERNELNIDLEARGRAEAYASKAELDALAIVTEQNLRVLKEDVEELAGLVEGCKRRGVATEAQVGDGMRGRSVERAPRLQRGIRDV
jgi:hypothetical protein